MEILTPPRPVLSEHTEEEEIHYRDGSIAYAGGVTVLPGEGTTVELLAAGSLPVIDDHAWDTVRPQQHFGVLVFDISSGYLWYRLRFTLPNR